MGTNRDVQQQVGRFLRKPATPILNVVWRETRPPFAGPEDLELGHFLTKGRYRNSSEPALGSLPESMSSCGPTAGRAHVRMENDPGRHPICGGDQRTLQWTAPEPAGHVRWQLRVPNVWRVERQPSARLHEDDLNPMRAPKARMTRLLLASDHRLGLHSLRPDSITAGGTALRITRDHGAVQPPSVPEHRETPTLARVSRMRLFMQAESHTSGWEKQGSRRLTQEPILNQVSSHALGRTIEAGR